MKKDRFSFLKRFSILRSLKARIFLIIFLAGIIPCIVLHYGIISNYESAAVKTRSSEVQTQYKALLDKIKML